MQAARKNAGLNVEDRIALTPGGDEELLEAARAHEDYSRETLATGLDYDGGDQGGREIEGELLIAVAAGRLAADEGTCRCTPAWPPFGQQLIVAIVSRWCSASSRARARLDAVLYWALAGPLAIGGGFLGGMEHRGADEGLRARRDRRPRVRQLHPARLRDR